MGKEILLQANIEGDKNEKYGLANALLCESNDKGIQLLLSILNQLDVKQLLQNYRQILRHTVLEQTHFASQKTKHARKMEWLIGL